MYLLRLYGLKLHFLLVAAILTANCEQKKLETTFSVFIEILGSENFLQNLYEKFSTT